MNTDNPQTYDQLLIKLVSINIFFVIFMTFFSFLVFLSNDYSLWKNCLKFDIFKVFFQNIRFNFSIAGYFNIPVFMLLTVLLLFRPAHIMKFTIGIIKSFYLIAFVAVFSLLTLSHMINNMADISSVISKNYFLQLSYIYSTFDNSTFITLAIVMSVIFLITVIFFILILKFVFKSREYAVEDHNKAIISAAAALLLCIFFAKGKIIGHLSVSDASVTPVIQLNEYAISGPYKIFYDLKNYDYSNIAVIKDREKLLNEGFVVLDDTEKAKQKLFRFTPNQSE